MAMNIVKMIIQIQKASATVFQMTDQQTQEYEALIKTKNEMLKTLHHLLEIDGEI